jgi:excinuclease UvrABC nuclease subunit
MSHWYHVPDVPAVYSIYGNGKLLYIGRTLQLRRRLMTHNSNLRLRQFLLRCEYTTCPPDVEFLRWLEEFLIVQFRPPFNCTYPGAPLKTRSMDSVMRELLSRRKYRKAAK